MDAKTKFNSEDHFPIIDLVDSVADSKTKQKIKCCSDDVVLMDTVAKCEVKLSIPLRPYLCFTSCFTFVNHRKHYKPSHASKLPRPM